MDIYGLTSGLCDWAKKYRLPQEIKDVVCPEVGVGLERQSILIRASVNDILSLIGKTDEAIKNHDPDSVYKYLSALSRRKIGIKRGALAEFIASFNHEKETAFLLFSNGTDIVKAIKPLGTRLSKRSFGFDPTEVKRVVEEQSRLGLKPVGDLHSHTRTPKEIAAWQIESGFPVKEYLPSNNDLFRMLSGATFGELSDDPWVKEASAKMVLALVGGIDEVTRELKIKAYIRFSSPAWDSGFVAKGRLNEFNLRPKIRGTEALHLVVEIGLKEVD